jgi:hypothetical protein
VLGAATLAYPRVAAAQPSAVVERWLECEECSEGELAAVIGLGAAAVPALATALAGPPAYMLDRVRASAVVAYATARRQNERRARTQVVPPPPDSGSYVGEIVENFRALRVTRAAQALAQIAPDRARTEIGRALAADSAGTAPRLRPVARRRLEEILRSLP